MIDKTIHVGHRNSTRQSRWWSYFTSSCRIDRFDSIYKFVYGFFLINFCFTLKTVAPNKYLKICDRFTLVNVYPNPLLRS